MQPPSAEALELVSRLRKLQYSWHELNLFDAGKAIDALIAQRVAAERERWQNRDRQRLEQIDRLQAAVQSLQSARAERPATPLSDLVHMAEHNVAVAAADYCRSRNSLGRHDSAMLHILEDALCERARICEQPIAERPAPPQRPLTGGEREVLHKALLASSTLVHSGDAKQTRPPLLARLEEPDILAEAIQTACTQVGETRCTYPDCKICDVDIIVRAALTKIVEMLR